MKNKAIVHVNGVYSLMQFFFLHPYSADETLFVFAGMPEPVVQRFSAYNTLNANVPWKSQLYIPFYLRFLSIVANDTVVYISWPAFYCQLFLDLFPTVFYLEEGIGDYYDCGKNKINKSKKLRWDQMIRYGRERLRLDVYESVKKIYLTGIFTVQEFMQHKVELASIQALWDKKTQEERELINRLFLPDDFNLTLLGARRVVLLTQPFCKDGAYRGLTKQDQIDVYRQLIALYDESDVIIKNHPRDLIDYRLYFPKALILAYPCPMELFILNGMKIKTAVTISSTAIYSLGDDVEKVITSESVFDSYCLSD